MQNYTKHDFQKNVLRRRKKEDENCFKSRQMRQALEATKNICIFSKRGNWSENNNPYLDAAPKNVI